MAQPQLQAISVRMQVVGSTNCLLASGSRHLFGLWAAAAARYSSTSSSSNTSFGSSTSRHASNRASQHPAAAVDTPQLQQQQPEHHQQPTQNWLQQWAGASRQQRLSALSCLGMSLQGKAAELKAAGPLHVLSAASSFLPQAALAAVTTAATVAASPAAVAGAAATSLAYFQGTRYQGNNSLSTNPNTYWLRKFGLDDSRVTAFLVAANVGCYGMQQLSSTFTAGCVRIGFKVAAGEYWRLLTAAFVHANLLHAGINTLALWNMGRMVEPQLGGSPFLAVYLGSAVCGNLLGYMMSPSFMVSMGSSSALFGLLGAFLSHSYINRHSVYVSRAQVVSVLQTIGINLALMTFFGAHMDNYAHFGGFIGGALIAAVVAPRYTH